MDLNVMLFLWYVLLEVHQWPNTSALKHAESQSKYSKLWYTETISVPGIQTSY